MGNQTERLHSVHHIPWLLQRLLAVNAEPRDTNEYCISTHKSFQSHRLMSTPYVKEHHHKTRAFVSLTNGTRPYAHIHTHTHTY